MTILVDHEDVTVDLNQGVESDHKTPGEQEVATPTSVVPDKFAGKSVEEVAAAYTNLESELGRMRNELGDYRTMTDRFLSIEEKRVADLGQEQAEEFTIDPTDLLANPEKVLNEYYEHRSAADPHNRELQERLDRIEGQVGQSSIEARHADAVTITNDPEFQNWVGSNAFRNRIAAEAVQNRDVDALDYLLTEWKDRNPGAASNEATGDTVSQAQQNEVRRAQSVATESSSSGNTGNTGKRFSRRKLVELKIRNADEYAARSDEILQAYAQGRVDD